MAIAYHNLYGASYTPAATSPTDTNGPTINNLSSPVSHSTDVSPAEAQCHLFNLPNELILHILSLLTTPQLVPLAPISQRIHALITRLLHARLTEATRFPSGSLILECYPPSQKLTAPALDCFYLGTPGIETCLSEHSGVPGKLDAMRNIYCRFKPQRREWRRFGRSIPGDIPGSRTHPTSAAAAQARWQAERDQEVVRQILSLEGHELFIQLEGNLHLVRQMGFIQNLVAIHEGYVRIWRDWLGQRAQVEAWEEEKGRNVDRVVGSSKEGEGGVGATAAEPLQGKDDSERILWLDGTKNVGLKVRVKEKKWRRNMPVLMYADEEVSVSYEVAYEELLVRTAHLVITLEKSNMQEDINTGKAVVFGSFR